MFINYFNLTQFLHRPLQSSVSAPSAKFYAALHSEGGGRKKEGEEELG